MSDAAPDGVPRTAPGTALLVALDFDGTLAPLVDDPAAARMTPAARAAVDRLAALPEATRTRLAFVSGRDLADLAARADPPAGSYLVGSHGAETGRATPDGVTAVPVELSDDRSAALRDLVAALEDAVAGRDGAWVQVKPSAAVLHTRLAGEADTAAATAAADAAARRLGLPAMHGKDVVEVAVVPASKGEALQRLRDVVAEATGAAVRVLYAGDDTTDERAFAVLGDDDVAVKVGPGPSAARRRVADAEALADLLQGVATDRERAVR